MYNEENVEFIVELPVRTVEPVVDLAVSKPKSMVLLNEYVVYGTHRVFPRFAIIWRRILVAILWIPFFLRVASVTIWVTI